MDPLLGTDASVQGRSAGGQAPVLCADQFDGVVCDLDGVITQTADLHAAAWRELFDDFLRRRADLRGGSFEPFDIAVDYRLHVDGRPRREALRSFLASRGVTLEEGSTQDPPERDTITSLAAAKDQLFLASLARSGVQVFGDAPPFIRRVREAGLRTAIVSSSRNAAAVLTATGLSGFFDVLVDGVEADRLKLAGKPAPDVFLHAARKLRTDPKRLAGFEDAIVGVEAIRAAGYGLVVGVDRSGGGAPLRRHGADLVVPDLAAIHIVGAGRRAQPVGGLAPAGGAELPVVPTEDETWRVVEEGFTLTREHEIESIFSIGNGRLGSRGSLAEGSALSGPATYVAGLFDEQPGLPPRLTTLPDWARLSLTLEGQPVGLDQGHVVQNRRVLDLRQGMLWRELRHADDSGRITRIRGFRLASMDDRRLLLQCVSVTPENYSGNLNFDTALGGVVVLRTSRGVMVALAAEVDLVGALDDRARDHADPPPSKLNAERGRTYRLDRIVAVSTSRDSKDPESAATAAARSAVEAGVPELVDRHRRAWAERWRMSDIRLEGAPSAQAALRFAAYHLLSAANPDDERVSIGARALTGSGYNGHVFWDTEIYMLPFLVLTWPAAARALLMYRHHTLPAARAKARRHGAQGASYAWESADTGEDVTPTVVMAPDGVVRPLRLAEQEQHVTADIAYAVWSYWRATGDERFLLGAGAEILIETARFWASRAEPGEDGLRHIRGVVGPDEYHEAVDDDAYTNGMARWNLETAAEASRWLAQRRPAAWRALSSRLGLEPGEIAAWEVAGRELYTGLDPATGLIEQFKGYLQLEDIDFAELEPRNAPIDVLLGRDRIQRSQIIKQPDVVMLLHLLWDRFEPRVRAANFRYYEPRCAHGSSLSPAIHALIAARLGDLALATRYFRQASEIDLTDNMGNAAAGVHAGALGGLWQAAVFGFAGLGLTENGPELHPCLPPSWKDLSFRVCWRGREYELRASASATAQSQTTDLRP